jgi:hypothetical protein
MTKTQQVNTVAIGQPIANFEKQYGPYTDSSQPDLGQYFFQNGTVSVLTFTSADNRAYMIIYAPF